MTRPKVAPDKRQRTAIACDACKRKKQKCNGHQPCSNCARRSLICTYGFSDSDSGNQSASKRRMLESPQTSAQGREDIRKSAFTSNPISQNVSPSVDIGKVTSAAADLRTWEKLSRSTNSLNGDEEAVMYNSSRMLQDPAGRLLYIGDAATLSFLQLVRMIVESTGGVSPFTLDPRRHKIVENTLSLPKNARTTQLLPPRETALVLLNSFFDHTCGLLEVVNRSAFMNDVENCYLDPHAVDPSWLCLLYLIFAAGLVFATPIPNTKEDIIIQKLRSEPLDRAEIFYCNAKNLGDPSTFENPDIWSIQTLLIMTLYMLAVAKRNRAYSLHGMAVRSAFALGLHREEPMVIFSAEEQTLRRNLWRSLFILDRFLSVSLGRPTSISEGDCSDALLPLGGIIPATGTLESEGLGASVRGCHLIGIVLDKVYAKRKVSTKLGQELADRCATWPKNLDSRLFWEQAPPIPQNQGSAILHVNLFYCHSIILLSRPFFLSVFRRTEQDRIKGQTPGPVISERMERFSEACLVASCHSIVLVQKAMEARFLSRRNPFVLYFLFSASLIVLCNEYAMKLHLNPCADTCINNALNIMSFMAQADPQAQRLHYILKCFHDVVIKRYQKAEMLPPQIARNPANPVHSQPVITKPIGTPQPERSIPNSTTISPSRGPSPYGPSHTPSLRHQQQQVPLPPIEITSSYNNTNNPTGSQTDPTIIPPQPPSSSKKSPGPLFDFQGFSFGSMSAADRDRHRERGQTTPDLNDPTEIDFEALWNWPVLHGPGTGTVPGTGPGIQSQDPLEAVSNGMGQGMVPLYNTEFMGLGGFQDDGQFMP